MKSIFKKLCALFAIGFAAFALGSCASVNHDATIKIKEYTIITTQAGDKMVQGCLEVYNNTIYNTKKISYKVIGYNKTGDIVETISEENVDFAVRHGTAGAMFFQDKINHDIASFEGEGMFTEYYNVWETYLGMWVAGIILVAISVTIYTVSICRSGLRRGELGQMMKDKVATLSFVFLFTLIICMFPLIYGSWVSTLILVGSFVSAGVLCLGVTGIRAATIKD